MTSPASRSQSTTPEDDETVTGVTFTLNARLQPVHRGRMFAESLDRFLSQKGLGEIEGGGSLQSKTGEIEYCDIVVLLHDPVDANAAAVASALESLGAPLGSRYRVDGADDVTAFGVNQGLGLYLNGTDLPDETYANEDVNELIDRLKETIDGHGRLMSFWAGPTETALYFYGKSFDQMADVLAPVIAAHPLAQQSRVEQIV